MKVLMFCVFAVMMLTAQGVVLGVSGEDEEQHEQIVDSGVGFQKEEEVLECFRCDLGFWDACYTTKTSCSLGELCYTGRGKAADVLDVKTSGCVKPEECAVETMVDIFSNNTMFVMTKHCCNTPFCNSAHKLPVNTLLYLSAAVLTTWQLTKASTGSR